VRVRGVLITVLSLFFAFGSTNVQQGSDWTIRDTSGKVLRRFKQPSATAPWVWDEDYIYRDGQLLAAEVASRERTLHFHPDHLGTPRLITGNGGALVSTRELHPFGEEITVPDNERMKFTGHERDSDSLDYMHARYYGVRWGRFLAVDPGKDWDPTQAQSWNMYAYVRNDPMNATDPDGQKAIVRRDGSKISIEIPVRFTGAAKTPERIAAFTNAVQTRWSGTFGQYEVTTRVTPGGVFDNRVRFDKAVGGASYVQLDRHAVINTYPDPDVQAGVDAHEAGHLMHHNDKYKTNEDRTTTTPHPGWEGNIMAAVPGATEEKNIEEILRKNRVRETNPEDEMREVVPPVRP
jgi:RHS repeat-associated protein